MAVKMNPTIIEEEIYNQKIMRMAADIPRIGALAHPDAHAKAVSRLCGSTVEVDLCMKDGRISDFAHQVRACVLGQAAASIMARNVIGATAEELHDVAQTMRAMLRQDGQPPQGKWRDLEILLPVRDYKARHASTLLAFDAVENCLKQIEETD